MMSNTYHYSLYIILLIFGDLKGCVRTRIITKSLTHIVTLCAKDLSAYRVDTVFMLQFPVDIHLELICISNEINHKEQTISHVTGIMSLGACIDNEVPRSMFVPEQQYEASKTITGCDHKSIE